MAKKMKIPGVIIGAIFVLAGLLIYVTKNEANYSGGAFGIIVGAVVLYFSLRKPRKGKQAQVVSVKATPAGGALRFQVAGLFYRFDVLKEVAQRHPDFGLSDADFIEKHADGRSVFEYRLKRSSIIKLIPEPTNEHDPNAVQVCVDGKMIGYVPASEAAAVRSLISGPCSVRGWIAGGARKSVEQGSVVTNASDLNVYVEITPGQPSA